VIVTRTPLRISFAGGGTDFADFYRHWSGAVLSTAIDKYLYVIVKERFDDLIYVGYANKEIVEKVEDVQHELVREALLRTGVKRGIEISIMADIPSEGSGLGSSSALTVGLLNALSQYQGIAQPADWLARTACEIEINELGRPIGKQDQYIAAYGGLRHITFLSDGSMEIRRPHVSESQCRRLEEQLLLFYTGITRKSESILTEQKANIADRARILKAMRDQVGSFRYTLEQGQFQKLGALLHEGWQMKKQLAGGITNPQIDDLYSFALAAGAQGGKVAGAGGGGFLLLHCFPGQQQNLRAAMTQEAGVQELPFNLERDGSRVIFNCR
jgi:D-glycero-alpha-D-manno-heptose-7-phosphate kinase